jgi:mannose-6-phosphate isomerase-like protein (cupin superfamily)
VPDVGQELTDPNTGARLRFVRTADSSAGASALVKLDVLEGWSAGPLHVHPLQTERIRVVDGTFHVRCDDEERFLQSGDLIAVPLDTRHTIRLVGASGILEAEFVPALRTDELFETMFSNGPRRPPGYVPAVLRAWVESRGYCQEIRYLWPRRAAALLAVVVALGWVGWQRV